MIISVSYKYTNLSLELSNHTRTHFWSESRRWVDDKLVMNGVSESLDKTESR